MESHGFQVQWKVIQKIYCKVSKSFSFMNCLEVTPCVVKLGLFSLRYKGIAVWAGRKCYNFERELTASRILFYKWFSSELVHHKLLISSFDKHNWKVSSTAVDFQLKMFSRNQHGFAMWTFSLGEIFHLNMIFQSKYYLLWFQLINF